MTPKYKWLATQIVRCAERWPDRIGPAGAYGGRGEDDVCLIITISREAYYGYLDSVCGPGSTEARAIATKAMRLSDGGVPWGRIPLLLGLVPGELKEEVTCETDSRVDDSVEPVAADVVCCDAPAELDHAGVG